MNTPAPQKRYGDGAYRQLPPVRDYSDDVTDTHRERIRNLVGDPKDLLADAESVGDAGW